MIDFGNDTDWIFSDDQLPKLGLYVLAFFRDRRLGGDYVAVMRRVSEYEWEEQGSERTVRGDPIAWALITTPDEVKHSEESPYYPCDRRLRDEVALTN